MEKNINYNVPTLIEALQQALEPVLQDYDFIKSSIENNSATPEVVNKLVEHIITYQPETKYSPLYSIAKVGHSIYNTYCDAITFRFYDIRKFYGLYPNVEYHPYDVMDFLKCLIDDINACISAIHRIDNLNSLRSALMSHDLDLNPYLSKLMENMERFILLEKDMDNAKRIEYDLRLLLDLSDVISTCWEQKKV